MEYKKLLLSGIVLALMVGCSDPKTYKMANLTDEQKQKIQKSLTPEEQELYLQFVMRKAWSSALSKTDIESSFGEITVGEAIEKQRELKKTIKEEELQEQKLKKKIEEKNKIFQEEIRSKLTLSLVKKENIEGDFSKFVEIEIAIENKSQKDIEGIKAGIIYKDIFDDVIMESSFSYDEGIKVGEVTIYKGSLRINEFMSEHNKLWTTELEKMKVTIIPEVIVFADGTKLSNEK